MHENQAIFPEGVRSSTDVGDLLGPPAGRIGQQAQREENSSEHLNGSAELREEHV